MIAITEKEQHKMSKKRKPKIEFRYYQLPEGSPILALLGDEWIRGYGWDTEYLHFHNYLEIGYCYDGTGTMILGEKECRYANGYFTVIPPNYPHTTTSDAGRYSRWEYLYIDAEGVIQDICRNGRHERAEQMQSRIYSLAFLRRASELPEISRMILHIMNIMRQKKEYYMDEAKGFLTALLVSLAREGNIQEMHIPKTGADAAMPVNLAVDYIAIHYMDPIKIDTLADKCHISEAHLRRLFESYIKMSPLEYINLVRIRIAAEYLKTTDTPVATIAQKCGFPILSTFNRNFKKIMGVSPNEWRKRPENYEQQLLKSEIQRLKGW